MPEKLEFEKWEISHFVSEVLQSLLSNKIVINEKFGDEINLPH